MNSNSTTSDIPLTTQEELLEDLDLMRFLPPKIKHYVYYDSIYPVSAKAILEVYQNWTNVFMSKNEIEEIEGELLEQIKIVCRDTFLQEPSYIEGMYNQH